MHGAIDLPLSEARANVRMGKTTSFSDISTLSFDFAQEIKGQIR